MTTNRAEGWEEYLPETHYLESSSGDIDRAYYREDCIESLQKAEVEGRICRNVPSESEIFKIMGDIFYGFIIEPEMRQTGMHIAKAIHSRLLGKKGS